MRKIDHIAIQVDDIRESVKWYRNKFKCEVIYEDDTWAFLQYENIKMALVVEDEHPYHIAFETDDKGALGGTLHRDGSISRLIKYPKQIKHFADGFHEGRSEDDMDELIG